MEASVRSIHEFYVRFWGVRKGTPVCEPQFFRYGGNTSCIEVRCGNQLFIFDTGTGCRYFGNSLDEGSGIDADVFFTRTNFEHVCGLPFFKPAFLPTNSFKFFAGHLLPDVGIQSTLQHMMREPLFPVPLQVFESKFSFHDFFAGETLMPRDGVVVHTALMQDAYKATAYRIEYDNRSICYLTNARYPRDRLEKKMYRLIEGADIVICDSIFIGRTEPDRLVSNDGIHFCETAGAKKLVIFPHPPECDDDFLDGVARYSSAFRPTTMIASEGMVLHP